MQFRSLISLAIFVGSYVPLAAILFVQDINYSVLGRHVCWPIHDRSATCAVPLHHPVLSISTLTVALACFSLTALALRTVRMNNRIDIKSARYIPAELINYTLPYIVSFMTIGYDDVGKLLGLLLFIGWMFCIVNKSGQLILNPVLAVFGWRLYDIEYSFPGDGRVLTSQALVKGFIASGAQYRQASLQDVIIIRPD